MVDGISFPSKAEGARYAELLMLNRGGVITSLDLQPRFVVFDHGDCKIEYVADFAYWDKQRGRRVVEDVKGMKTPEYMLKRKMFLAVFGYELWEIHGKKRVQIKLANGRAVSVRPRKCA